MRTNTVGIHDERTTSSKFEKCFCHSYFLFFSSSSFLLVSQTHTHTHTVCAFIVASIRCAKRNNEEDEKEKKKKWKQKVEKRLSIELPLIVALVAYVDSNCFPVFFFPLASHRYILPTCKWYDEPHDLWPHWVSEWVFIIMRRTVYTSNAVRRHEGERFEDIPSFVRIRSSIENCHPYHNSLCCVWMCALEVFVKFDLLRNHGMNGIW